MHPILPRRDRMGSRVERVTFTWQQGKVVDRVAGASNFVPHGGSGALLCYATIPVASPGVARLEMHGCR